MANIAIGASTWNPTLVVNTEAFQVIDDTDSTANVVLRFGESVNEEIRWDRTKGLFQFTDDIEVIGSMSGASLTLSSLRNCNTIDTNANGVLSCGTDETGASIPFTSTGSLQTYFDNRFINSAGDTMTGALKVRAGVSGTTLRIDSNADIWGALSATGSLKTQSGAVLNSDNDTNDAVLVFGNAAAVQTLKYLNSRQMFQFSRSVSIQGSLSGTTLRIDKNADIWGNVSATGSVKARGGFSGSSLTISNLRNCDTIDTNANGVLSCGTDDGGAGGISQTDGDSRYVHRSGATMTGALTIDVANTSNGTAFTAQERVVLNSGATLSGSLLLQARNDPGTPSSDSLALYAKEVSGRMLLKAKGPSGLDYPYQPSFFQNQIVMVSAGGGTAVSTLGSTTTNSATLSHPAADQVFGYMTNFATSATSGNESGLMTVGTPFFRGSTVGANGFFFNARVGVVDITSARIYVGLSSATSLANQMASDDVAGSRAGFAFSTVRGDTNWQVTFKDGTTQNLINSNVTVASSKVYDMYLFCSPQCSTIYWRIDNVTDNTTTEGSTTSNLPAGATGMKAFIGIETQTTAARNLRMQRIYVESDR